MRKVPCSSLSFLEREALHFSITTKKKKTFFFSFFFLKCFLAYTFETSPRFTFTFSSHFRDSLNCAGLKVPMEFIWSKPLLMQDHLEQNSDTSFTERVQTI